MYEIDFAPIIPAWCIATATLALAGLAVAAFRAQAATISTPRRTLLLTLRLAAFLLVVAWLLAPVRRIESPRPDASRIAILLDSSASMGILKDCNAPDGRRITRWEAAVEMLEASETHASPLDTWLFAGRGEALAEWRHTPEFPGLPGETDIGGALDALRRENARPGALPIRSVILISDGRDWGGSATDAAKRLAAEGIPVSTRPLGSPLSGGDLSVAFAPNTPDSIPLNETGQAQILVASSFPDTRNARVSLEDEAGRVLAQHPISVPPNASATTTLEIPAAAIPGERLLVARITPPEEDARPENDAAFHVLEDARPGKCRLLYLAANPDWEWRFLRKSFAECPEMEAAAIIRVGLPDDKNEALSPDWRPNVRFFQLNCTADGFPDTLQAYADFDLAIVPCQTAAEFTPQQQEALAGFVERQGGGLLWIGDPSTLPETLARLVPGRTFESTRAGFTTAASLASEELVFEGLFQTPAKLPPGTPYLFCRQPARTARRVLEDQRGNPILVVQGNYGAGRVAWSGLTESWHWAFSADNPAGNALHRSFWRQLAGWLGENRQPQLELEIPEGGLNASQENTVALRILGPDFRPAAAPQTRLEVKFSDGTTATPPLLPDPDELGRFTARITPPAPGAAKLKFSVRTTPAAAEPITLEKWLPVNPHGKELENLAPDYELLRDIARITGGATIGEPTIPWNSLPASHDTPYEIIERRLMDSPIILVAAILALLVEYTLRRRLGQA